MIFECANREFLHASVMSGLTPTKSMDDILGVPDPPDPMTFPMLPPEERERFTKLRSDRFKEWNRAELVEELRSNNHAVEPIIEPWEMFSHPQTIANDMTATVD